MKLLEHNCELFASETILQVPEGFITFCKRKIRAWTIINKNHPKCSLYAISLAAVAKEKKRHVQSAHPWIIHPYSQARFAWEIFFIFVYFFSFLTIPFMNCFIIQDYDSIRFDNVNFGIYAIYWIDLIFNCLTGFYSKKEKLVILHQGKILLNYLKGYLLLDVFSSIPYDRVTGPWRNLPGPNSFLVVDFINLLPLLKLSRYFTFKNYIFQILMHFNVKYFSYQIFTTVLLYLFIIYWTTCFCFVIPIMMMKAIPFVDYKDIWLSEVEGIETPDYFRNALYIVLDNFTGSGYGLIEPKSELHLILCTMLMITGRIFECYIIVLIFQYLNEKNATKSKALEIIDQVAAYANQKQLPLYLKKRILSYYHYQFQNNYFREKEILSKLTDELRTEVALHSCRHLVENVAIFHNLPKNVLISIVATLKPGLYLENDVIVKAGTHGDSMYFLARGTVAVLTPTGKEICHLEDGAHFGEVALLVQDQKRVASVVAVEVCEVFRLDRIDFRKVIAIHSDLFAKIEKIAIERIERTMLIEEQHKRILMESSKLPSFSKPPRSTNVRFDFN